MARKLQPIRGLMPVNIDFAIDYDDTFSAHPEIWAETIKLWQTKGLKTICATNRSDTEGNRNELKVLDGLVVDIVFCKGYKKDECLKKGYSIAVWIDNDPRVDQRPAPLWWCKMVGGIQWLLKKIGLR